VLEILETELLDDKPVEVACKREVEAEVRGERSVRAVAFDRHAHHTCSEVGEALVVLTEPFELGRSNPAEVEQVPGQHDRAVRQQLLQRDRCTAGGRERKGRHTVANAESSPLFGHAPQATGAPAEG
jgi:hypothetical protein